MDHDRVAAPSPSPVFAGAYRPVRSLVPPETPFPAVLAREGEQAVLLVDIQVMPAWRGADDNVHVLAARDIARRPDGHDAVLPWCVESITAFLSRRAAGAAPLSAGEIVTLAASLLRGWDHARRTPERGAAWWLTDEGMPVLVWDAVGSAPAIEATTSVLREIAHTSDLDAGAAVVERLASAIAEGADVAPLEPAVFALGQARALDREQLTPRRVTGLRPRGDVTAPVVEDAAPAGFAGLVRRMLRRHVDEGLGDLMSDAVDRTRRRGSELVARRRMPWIVAAATAAAVVVAGGLLWPVPPDPAESADRGSLETTSPRSDPVPGPSSAPMDPDGATAVSEPAGPTGLAEAAQDPVAALDGLLRERADCTRAGDAQECFEGVFEQPAQTLLPAGAVDLAPDTRAIELLDDLGGVAVLRIRDLAETMPAQLVVLVIRDGGWRIRDVTETQRLP
ncbi:MAG: hypothetical protein DI573_10335 [Microbacterium sp.]|uniref:hypothetical protein n=1 Tax=Microbacterium sp. TaxID=51671 RepID=UPI000DB75D30|nr:hypothetical protein [Microbacterium sp.]PZU38160.1 MAG: hypothetical protein DI573_10335 [Microbacterium sp.]